MLRFLRVTHLAVIDSVEVEFDAGLNVLTGETGAGKSILVEAVGLLLGGRASGDLVRTGEDAASIEAIFERGDAEVLVRREITAQGRSRAFINGALATAGSLKELAATSSSCTASTSIRRCSTRQPTSASSMRSGSSSRSPPRSARPSRRCARRPTRCRRLRRAIADRDARLDLLTFQLSELDRANLKAQEGRERAGGGREGRRALGDGGQHRGEDVELAALRQVLASAERVERLCEESYASLYESDGAILAGLGHVWRRVAELAALDPQFQPYLDARDGIKSQLEDLALFLRRYADGIEASPARLQQIEDRLALLDRLKRKYGPSLGDVVARRDALRRELDDLQQGDDRIAQLEREHRGGARALSGRGRGPWGRPGGRSAGRFARELERLLAELAMERTRFEVRFAGVPTRLTDGVRRGRRTGSTSRNSSSRPTPARICGRSPASSRAASCRGSCWPSRR